MQDKPGSLRRVEQRSPPAGRPLGDVRLCLLNGFDLCYDGESVPVTITNQRVVGFLALHDRPLRRLFVAGALWSDATEEHANANLRSALWRLRRPGYSLINCTTSHIRLDPAVTVDLREVSTHAHRLLDSSLEPTDASLDLETLCGDLLPDWYDDWVLIEQERFRQLRLHALEALCERLTAQRRFAPAVEAGLSAVAAEPLRESAYRALIRAHLAEGNSGEAIRQYHLFERLLEQELGIEPSLAITSLLPMVRT